jgi:hypothetical protein
MERDDVLATMRAAGPPLAEVVGPPQRGVGPLPTARLIVDKATRDQIVIFDPLLAPHLRRVVRSADVRPWYCETPHYLIVLTPEWTAAMSGAATNAAQAWERMAERCPPLQQRLAPATASYPLDEAWWERSIRDETIFVQPRVIWSVAGVAQRFALTEPGWLAGPGTCHAPGSFFLLGVLMSRLAWLALTVECQTGNVYRLTPERVGRLPIPDAADAERAAVESLAQRIVALTRERVLLERQFTQRLVKDFGPPGVMPGARLERWWNLEFDALRSAIAARFGGDIPARFREQWAAQHADAVARRVALSDAIALAEDALNVRVARLYGVEGCKV